MADREHWKPDPDKHDYPAAADFLSLILPEAAMRAAVTDLRRAPLIHRKAKDLLRASGLPPLPPDDPDVHAELRKVKKAQRLSPVLLVRGDAEAGAALIIADGYHRICASYHLDEDADIPCRLATLANRWRQGRRWLGVPSGWRS